MQSRVAATARVLFLAMMAFAPSTLLPGHAAAQQDVRIPWQGGWLKDFNEGVAAGELAAKLYRPAGDAPAPFIVFLHAAAAPAPRSRAIGRNSSPSAASVFSWWTA